MRNMVSGDVVFRIMHILAFNGAVPLSSIGVLLAAKDLGKLVSNIGENYTLVALASMAAVLVIIIAFLLIRYPVPREATIGLRVGIFSSVLAGMVFWVWLTHTYAYAFPLLVLSELYTVATLAFIDSLLAIMAILVALVTTIERM